MKRAELAPVDSAGAYDYTGILPLASVVFRAAVRLVRMPIRWIVLDGTRREV